MIYPNLITRSVSLVCSTILAPNCDQHLISPYGILYFFKHLGHKTKEYMIRKDDVKTNLPNYWYKKYVKNTEEV